MASFFDNIFGLFTGKPKIDAYTTAGNKLSGAFDQYGGLVTQGLGDLNTNYMKAINQFMPYQGAGATGLQGYLDAIGLGGPEGRARAEQNYIEGPGVQSAIRAATDAINRAGNAGGVAIGNSAKAGADAATNIALNDYYKNYVGAINPLLGLGERTAGNVAGLYQGIGNQTLAALLGQGKMGMDVASQLGAMDVGKANAGLEGANNFLNTLGNVATFAAGGGIGKLGSSLFSGMTGKNSLIGW